MRYFNLKYIRISFLLMLILLLISYSHFIFSLDFNNKKIILRLKIKLFFKLIRINIQLYPSRRKKKKKKKKGSLKDLKLLEGELTNIVNLIKKMKIMELYSDIYFGNNNPYITVYITTLINGIYGNIINIFNCEKLYLNITPNFKENNVKGSIKLHIKFRLSSILSSIPMLIRIMKKKNKTREGDKNDSY